MAKPTEYSLEDHGIENARASQITGKAFKASKLDIPDAIASLDLLIAASVSALQEP